MSREKEEEARLREGFKKPTLNGLLLRPRGRKEAPGGAEGPEQDEGRPVEACHKGLPQGLLGTCLQAQERQGGGREGQAGGATAAPGGLGREEFAAWQPQPSSGAL